MRRETKGTRMSNALVAAILATAVFAVSISGVINSIEIYKIKDQLTQMERK
jgi:type II secretory pathway component PulK